MSIMRGYSEDKMQAEFESMEEEAQASVAPSLRDSNTVASDHMKIGIIELGGWVVIDNDKTPKEWTDFLLDWVVFSFAAMSGTTLRIIIAAWTDHDPTSLWGTTSSSIVENIMGCGILAFSMVFERDSKRRFDYALQTGLCGSFTTYGSMTTYAVKFFLIGAQGKPTWVGFTDTIFSMLVNLVLSHAVGYRLGRTLGKIFLRGGSRVKKFVRRYLNGFFILIPLIAGSIIAMFWSRNNGWNLNDLAQERCYGVLMAPIGAVLRAVLALKLNKKPRLGVYYLGTLLANVGGTFVGSVNAGYLAAMGNSVILNVLDLGFAATLSTVSTYVKEVNVLSEKQEKRGSTELSLTFDERGNEDLREFLAVEKWVEFPEVYIVTMSMLTIGFSILGFVVGGWRPP